MFLEPGFISVVIKVFETVFCDVVISEMMPFGSHMQH